MFPTLLSSTDICIVDTEELWARNMESACFGKTRPDCVLLAFAGGGDLKKKKNRLGYSAIKVKFYDFVSIQAELQGPGGIQSRGYFLYRVWMLFMSEKIPLDHMNIQ